MCKFKLGKHHHLPEWNLTCGKEDNCIFVKDEKTTRDDAFSLKNKQGCLSWSLLECSTKIMEG